MQYAFGPFRLDTTTQQVWLKGQHVALPPRPFAVLAYLLTHAGEVVDSATLLKEVWGPTRVGKAAVKVCLRAIREALGDDAATPRYIETVGRVGYRFIEKVVSSQCPAVSGKTTAAGSPTFLSQHSALDTRHSVLVGREAELAYLHSPWKHVLHGTRQILFVTGEPGIGKTMLVDKFLQTLDPHIWVGRGQCFEQYGEGEAYLPVLEVLGQLCRGPDGPQVLDVIRRMAPTWLTHLPRRVSTEEAATLQEQVPGTTPARMLREMAEALEALAAHRPLVLVLEDLHWSDRSTLDLLAYVAQRRESARLYVIGTYRPAEAATAELPLLRLTDTVQAHGQGVALPLDRLSAEAVTAYVQHRFAGQRWPEELATSIHRRSEGNALFMVALADYYEREGRMGEEEVPTTVQQLIAHQLTQLSTDQQQVVEGASVAGVEFGSVVVAAGLGVEPEAVDEVCAELSRRGQLVQWVGVRGWPDSTLSGRYQFRHALYQHVVYQQVPALRRVRLHRQMGERLEAGYGKEARERAAELALHFERGREIEKAVAYYQLAGENALRRSAYQEAAEALRKGLALVETLPQTLTRLTHQLRLQTALVPVLMALKGHTSVEVEEAYLRARALCEQAGDTERLFFVRLGLFRVYNTRSAYQQAYEYAQACLAVATQQQNATLFLGAHYALGLNAFYQGRLAEAQTQTTQGIACYTPAQHQIYVKEYGFDPVIGCLLFGAATLWLRGYPDQAKQQIEQALRTVQDQPHPFTLAFRYFHAALCAQLLRQEQEVAAQAEAGVTLATQHGFLLLGAFGTGLLGWSQLSQGEVAEGIARMRTSLALMRERSASVHRPHFLTLLAEAVGKTGDYPQAGQLIEEALAEGERNGEHFYEAETWRIKGELLLAWAGKRPQAQGLRGKRGEAKEGCRLQATGRREKTEEAEACFHKALDIARKQQAKSLELRATMSLARLWQRQGKKTKARRMVAKIYGWFSEGFDTADLQEARGLLKQLAH